MRKIFFGLLLVASTATAGGEFFTGQQWLDLAKSGKDASTAFALGYAVGVHDAAQGVTSCTGAGFTPDQLGLLVVKTAQDIPKELLKLSADRLIVGVLVKHYPCPKVVVG